jgi:hypothetical protein
MSQGTGTLWALISPAGVVSISFDKDWLEEFYITTISKRDQEVFKIVPFEVNLCNAFSPTATKMLKGLQDMDWWALWDAIEEQARLMKTDWEPPKTTQFRMLRMFMIMFYIGGIYVEKDPFEILPQFIEEDNE